VRALIVERMAGEFVEAFDAALQQAYAPRDPYAEFLQGRISARQLRVLSEGLPINSAFARASNGHAWTDETALLHITASSVRLLTEIVGNFVGIKPPLKFDPIPTPDMGGSAVDAAEQEREKAEIQRQKVELRAIAERIFANPD
jgi:hypothetical protein